MPRTAPTVKSKEVGARLKALRLKAGLKQAEVAAAIGVERSTLTGNETGAAMPGREAMANLARFYGVSIDYLERGTPPVGDNESGETIQNVSEASLVRFWRILDSGQKDRLLALIAEMIGARVAPSSPSGISHGRTPNGTR